jgi:hypothetical protein
MNPPDVYNFSPQVWEEDFLTSHSPAWWTECIARSSELQVEACQELADGQRYFEEQALLTDPGEGYLGLNGPQARQLEIRRLPTPGTPARSDSEIRKAISSPFSPTLK